LIGICILETVVGAFALAHGVAEHVKFSISHTIRAVINYSFDLLICPEVAVKHQVSPPLSLVRYRHGWRLCGSSDRLCVLQKYLEVHSSQVGSMVLGTAGGVIEAKFVLFEAFSACQWVGRGFPSAVTYISSWPQPRAV
jgi:hypothetical protein